MFSALCLQGGGYFHTGSNSKTMEQCAEEMKAYLLSGIDCDEDDQACWEKTPAIQVCGDFEVEIVEHDELVTP